MSGRGDVGCGAPVEPLTQLSGDVEDEMEAQRDGVDSECDIMVKCPKCDSPLVYQRGRVECIECDWSFGYCTFKRRFLSELEYDDSISPEEAANNCKQLEQLVSDNQLSKSGHEGLVDGMVGDVDPNRIASATTKLSGGLGDNGDGDADEGNGQVVKRSKEETLRLLKRLDLSTRDTPDG